MSVHASATHSRRVSSRIWAHGAHDIGVCRPATTVYLSQIPLSPLHPESYTLIQSSIIRSSQCCRVFVCWFYSLSPIAVSVFVILVQRTSIAFTLIHAYPVRAFPLYFITRIYSGNEWKGRCSWRHLVKWVGISRFFLKLHILKFGEPKDWK